MDVRDSAEQAELRRTARQLARELGPRIVADLDDAKRTQRLAEAVRDAGWTELRDADDAGGPLAGGVEAAIIAEALGETVADVAFAGPVLAADLARRAGVASDVATAVAFPTDLIDAAAVSGPVTASTLYAVDVTAGSDGAAYVLVPEGDGFRLGLVERPDGTHRGTDLTRALCPIAAGAAVRAAPGQQRILTREDLAAWRSLGLALGSADLVGTMRGLLDLSVAYVSERRQYGVPVGSFQAVQHLLAEGRCLMEGALSASLYASWAVDELPAEEARAAGRVAKAYAVRAARTVGETAVQVHGGMGNTWECIVHVYLRRALLSSRWFGDDGEMLHQIEQTRLGRLGSS